MLHTKVQEDSANRFQRRRFLQDFFHIWAWPPSWSYVQDHLYNFSFPDPWRRHMKFGFDWLSGFKVDV